MFYRITRFSVILLFLSVMCVASPSQAQWTLIDNFDSYNVGDDLDGLSDGSGMWEATLDFYAIDADPAGGDNKVLVALELDSGTKQAVLDDPSVLVADGTQATLFARFYRDNLDTHVNFGLSDVEFPADWADFESQARDQTGFFFARDGAAFTEFDNVDELPEGEWINFWMVIDNGTDTNEYYLQSGTTFPNQFKLAAGNRDVFDFRNGTDDDLIRFFLRCNIDGTFIHVGPWYLDDIYLDVSGENLTNPLSAGGAPQLWAGDADMDLDFDQLDLVKVQIAAKYLTGQPATWGDGDWNGAPGGEPGSPPTGNSLFDQLDIIAALAPGHYLTGSYAAIQKGGSRGDTQTSIVYNASTGEVAVDAPAGTELTSINIDSAAGIFTGNPAENLGGSFDNDADSNIFKATFGSSFGSLSFGYVAQAGLSEDFVAGDLTVVGSLNGGGSLGDVDLIYVPEPATLALLALGLLGLTAGRRGRRRVPVDQ